MSGRPPNLAETDDRGYIVRSGTYNKTCRCTEAHSPEPCRALPDVAPSKKKPQVAMSEDLPGCVLGWQYYAEHSGHVAQGQHNGSKDSSCSNNEGLCKKTCMPSHWPGNGLVDGHMCMLQASSSHEACSDVTCVCKPSNASRSEPTAYLLVVRMTVRSRKGPGCIQTDPSGTLVFTYWMLRPPGVTSELPTGRALPLSSTATCILNHQVYKDNWL